MMPNQQIEFTIKQLAKSGFQDPVTEEQNQFNDYLEAHIKDLKGRLFEYHCCSYIKDYNGSHTSTIAIVKNLGVWRLDATGRYKSPSLSYCPWCGVKLERGEAQ